MLTVEAADHGVKCFANVNIQFDLALQYYTVEAADHGFKLGLGNYSEN